MGTLKASQEQRRSCQSCRCALGKCTTPEVALEQLGAGRDVPWEGSWVLTPPLGGMKH